jgi:manganese-transporting P-type ATPase
VPGDLISLRRAKGGGSGNWVIPADAVIVKGGLVVNEAMLTGESTPLLKESLDVAAAAAGPEGTDRALDLTADRLHVVSAGTALISHSPPPPPDSHTDLIDRPFPPRMWQYSYHYMSVVCV